MAFYDWDHNGKKDIVDDFIEFQIIKHSMDNHSNNKHMQASGGGISTFGALVATIGGLFLAATILALLGGGENTPAFITIILWIVCGTGLSIWFDNIGF